MCRNIKRLRRPEGAPTDQELQDAALQFVRKISGFHKPSRANQETFDRAVHDIARVARQLFDTLEVRAPAQVTGTDHEAGVHGRGPLTPGE